MNADIKIREAAVKYNAGYQDIVDDLARGKGRECVSVSVSHPYANRHNHGNKYIVSAMPGVYVSGSGFAAAADPVFESFRSRPSDKAIRSFVERCFGRHELRFPCR